jgi:hypothetical protein
MATRFGNVPDREGRLVEIKEGVVRNGNQRSLGKPALLEKCGRHPRGSRFV